MLECQSMISQKMRSANIVNSYSFFAAKEETARGRMSKNVIFTCLNLVFELNAHKKSSMINRGYLSL